MEPHWNAASSLVELQAILWRMRAELERLIAEAGPGRMETPGVMGDWNLKDAIAHLTEWRWWSVARMEGALKNTEPSPPWGPDLTEETDHETDQINEQFYAANRGRSVADLLADSRATLDRLEAATLALSESELFDNQRYPWLNGYAPADVVIGSAEHLFEDHVPGIEAFLARGA
jgi:hypothetical protein